MASAQHSLSLSPIRSNLAFGRRVTGASVSEVLASPSLQSQVRHALADFGFLVFPEQQLSPSEEAAFAKLFPYDADVPLVDCAGPFATVQMTGVYGLGAGGAGSQITTMSSRKEREELYGQEGAPAADRWKLPELPMVQIQGHGTVRAHHGVADGTLSSAQDFAEWHTDGVHDVPTSTNCRYSKTE